MVADVSEIISDVACFAEKDKLQRLLNDIERIDIKILLERVAKSEERQLKQILPLHFSNYCLNECLYCGHRAGNNFELRRVHSIHSMTSLIEELASKGAKSVQLIFNYNEDELQTIAEVAHFAVESGLTLSICTEGLNFAELQVIKSMGIDEYFISQETFDKGRYIEVHLSGRKSDYVLQYEAPEHACRLGFKVGVGLLLGLYDWRPDVLILISRIKALMGNYPTADIKFFFNLLRATPGGQIVAPVTPITPLLLKKIITLVKIECPRIRVVTTTREIEYAELADLVDYEIVSFQGHKGFSI